MLASSLSNLEELGKSLLIVLGGAIAGAIVTALGVYLLCKHVVKKQPPEGAKKLLRWLGALTGALAVAGYLHFGGGLFGSDKGNGQTDPKMQIKGDEPKSKTEGSGPVQPERVRIVVLGGTLVRRGRYFRIEGQNDSVDLAAVRTYLEKRHGDRPVAAVDILIYDNSVAEQHDQIGRLIEAIRDLKLQPAVVKVSGDIPN